jgi:hypothetical protein
MLTAVPAQPQQVLVSRATTLTLRPRPPMLLASTSPRPRRPLCYAWTRSLQALERAQGYLKLPNGRVLTDHDYKRHGTTTLFAALEVATGKIIATHSKRRRRVEFLDFLNSVTAAFPGRKLHVILDNLNTHKKSDTAAFESALADLFLGPDEGLGFVVVRVDVGIDVFLLEACEGGAAK